ncbi:hypothetical protein [uncultured Hymenobacter sp.]
MIFLVRWMIKLTNFHLTFADHYRQETLLREPGLNWTIARP